jgi:hypothetical protein
VNGHGEVKILDPNGTRTPTPTSRQTALPCTAPARRGLGERSNGGNASVVSLKETRLSQTWQAITELEGSAKLTTIQVATIAVL